MLKKSKKPLEEAPDSWLNRWKQRWKQRFIQLAASFGDWYYGLYNRAYQEIIRLLPVKQRVLWLDNQLFALGVYAGNNILTSRKFVLTILLCTEIIPYLIVATALFVDVYYFGKFQYFYVSLYLMIIPIAWKALLAMLKEIAESTLQNIAKYICYKPVDPANPKGEWSWFVTDEGEKHDEILVNLDHHSRIILVDLEDLDEIRETFRLYFLSVRLLIALIFLISWSLVIYKLF